MTSRIGRNEPCPCGSGKKYERCCLHQHEATAERTAGAPARAAAQLAPPVFAWEDDDGLDEASNRVGDLVHDGTSTRQNRPHAISSSATPTSTTASNGSPWCTRRAACSGRRVLPQGARLHAGQRGTTTTRKRSIGCAREPSRWSRIGDGRTDRPSRIVIGERGTALKKRDRAHSYCGAVASMETTLAGPSDSAW